MQHPADHGIRLVFIFNVAVVVTVVVTWAVRRTTRVLLGDPGGAIIRGAPVPVVLTPGTTTLS